MVKTVYSLGVSTYLISSRHEQRGGCRERAIQKKGAVTHG